ncbi:hypothetical protein GRF29_19g1434461 [Pseudopithomyces chartarum]|uniref:Uncharacterized protein n=1 Tax=Pseudopithomyces chartarum TaxID=1892770 RepID=A0AAN6RIT5_9PLEO|nr:hypothetical protein GRF29_19g1434461 [Pseudopithomyces chartarum]
MQNPQQLPHHPLPTHTPVPPLEPHSQALEALPQEEEEHDLDTSSVSEIVTRYHHRRESSTRQFGSDDEEGGSGIADRKDVEVPKRPSFNMMPLPTIETIMERLHVQDGADIRSGRGVARAKEETQVVQPVYKTVVHVPKPPGLVRRDALDAAMLKRVLRERARLQVEHEQGGDDDLDVPMEDCDERESTTHEIDEMLLAISPTPSFYTAASTRSSCTPSSSSSSSSSSSPSEQTSPSPVPILSPPSPAYPTTALPPTSAYASPPCNSLPTPIHHSLSAPPSPTWKPVPLDLIPSLDLGDPLFDDSDDDMDWGWSMNGGEVVYGAAGLAVNSRVIIGEERNMCCHYQCGMDTDTDMDMELYVIDEESEEESGVEEG